MSKEMLWKKIEQDQGRTLGWKSGIFEEIFDDPGLRRRVREHARVPVLARDGRDIHDAAVVRGEHT